MLFARAREKKFAILLRASNRIESLQFAHFTMQRIDQRFRIVQLLLELNNEEEKAFVHENHARFASHLRLIAFHLLNAQFGIFDRALKLIVRFDQLLALSGDGLVTLFAVVLRSCKASVETGLNDCVAYCR